MRFVGQGREARPASASWNVCKTLVQVVLFWSVFLALLPAAIFIAEGALESALEPALEKTLGVKSLRFGSAPTRWIGGVLFALGGALGLSTGILVAISGRGTPIPFDCPRELVVIGPYRYLRNPMAVAGIAQGIAVGLFVGSPAIIAYALVGAPAWHFVVRPWEEADLERRFGLRYQQYRAAVRCWIPRFR